MKPLVTNYRVLTWLCVCPPQDAISWSRKLAYITLIIAISMGSVIIIATSVAFFTRALPVDLEQCLFSLDQIVGYFGLTYLIVVAFFLRREIAELFGSLGRIYEASKIFSDRLIFFQIFSQKYCSMCEFRPNFH